MSGSVERLRGEKQERAHAVEPDVTGPKQAAWFKPGQSGNPAGRPKGARNKLSEKFLETMAADFEAHGCAVIERVREEYPHYYLRVVAALMPKHVELETKMIGNRSIHDFSDRELLEIIVAEPGDLSPETREEFRPMLDGTPK